MPLQYHHGLSETSRLSAPRVGKNEMTAQEFGFGEYRLEGQFTTFLPDYHMAEEIFDWIEENTRGPWRWVGDLDWAGNNIALKTEILFLMKSDENAFAERWGGLFEFQDTLTHNLDLLERREEIVGDMINAVKSETPGGPKKPTF